MANSTEQLAALNSRITGLQSRLIGLSPHPIIYAATGATVFYGCKVTQGASASDMTIALESEAAGDTDHLNPDLDPAPVYPFQFGNIACLSSGAFYSGDLTAEVAAVPGTGLGRYDIAYIFVGPTGPGFAVATGTPSIGTKTAFDTDGLKTTAYDDSTDAALPVGAIAVARIYVEDDVTGIPNSRIADIRNFEGRLQGSALTWADLTTGQKNELIDPAIAGATAAVLADNEEFKQQQRVLFWLGI